MGSRAISILIAERPQPAAVAARRTPIKDDGPMMIGLVPALSAGCPMMGAQGCGKEHHESQDRGQYGGDTHVHQNDL